MTVKSNDTKQKIYPWITMIACCIFTGASIGVGTNCNSIFVPVLAKEFGVGLGAMSTQSTVMCVFMSAVAPWVGRAVSKTDVRKLMTLAAIISGCAFTAQGFINNIWQYYITGALLGTGVGIGCFMLITSVINNWFVKNNGLVVGITMSVSSVVGIIMNPLLNSIIQNHSWRYAAMLKGGLMFATIPVVWLFIRTRPSDRGVKAWGEEDHIKSDENVSVEKNQTADISTKEIFSSKPFLMMLVFSFLFTVCMNHSGHMQNIASSAGFSSEIGAMMLSGYLAGEFVGKLGIGWLNDRYGINRAVYLVTVFGMLGIFGLFFAQHFGANFAIICSLLFGPMTATTSVGFTLIANNTFGSELYPRYYPYMSIASNIAFSVGSPLIGFMYDFTGGWGISYIFVLCSLVISLGLLTVSTKMMAKEKISENK